MFVQFSGKLTKLIPLARLLSINKRTKIMCIDKKTGNNLISQYFVPIAAKIGITRTYEVVRYNVGKEAWGFLVSLILASITPRFPRRRMYLLCASCLLAIYTAWTIAQARNRITGSKESGYAVLVLIFLYSPGTKHSTLHPPNQTLPIYHDWIADFVCHSILYRVQCTNVRLYG